MSNTNIARAMGYLKSPSAEEVVYSQNNIVVVGPLNAQVRSYHQSGKSSKDEYLEKKCYADLIKNEWRL